MGTSGFVNKDVYDKIVVLPFVHSLALATGDGKVLLPVPGDADHEWEIEEFAFTVTDVEPAGTPDTVTVMLRRDDNAGTGSDQDILSAVAVYDGGDNSIGQYIAGNVVDNRRCDGADVLAVDIDGVGGTTAGTGIAGYVILRGHYK